jgi:formylglycine-generating enzyme required for sulfatase activity
MPTRLKLPVLISQLANGYAALMPTRIRFFALCVASFLLLNNAIASAQPTSRPNTGQAWRLQVSPTVPLDMMWIPPGSFTMGSPEGEPSSNANERPQTKVTLTKGFWLGKTIFTIGQWKAFTGRGVREQLVVKIKDDTEYDFPNRKTTIRQFMNWDPNADPGQYLANAEDDIPMYFVSWNDVMEMCNQLTEREKAAGLLPDGYEYTLPTEAQFEYATRAGTTEATYAGPLVIEGRGSPTIDKIGWYSGNSSQGYVGKGLGRGGNMGPRKVAQKLPNAWGLYDMSGNIWQWCRDYFGPYPGGELTDPTGPATGTQRVNRAGSFGSDAGAERSARRAQNPPAEASAYRGFRLALAPK